MELIITLIVLIIIWCVAFMVGNKQGTNRIINQIKKDGGYFDMEITGAVYPYRTSSADENVKGYFQQLAGITPVEMAGSVSPTNLTTKKLNESVVEKLKSDFENGSYPEQSPTINVITQKLYTIDRNATNSDPLADLPMSRVSKETKEQIVEMVKADITKQVEEKAKLIPIATEMPDEIKSAMMEATKSNKANIETKSDNNKK
jgi:hypothetical protein